MRIKIRKFKWILNPSDEWENEFEDDIVRPFYFTFNLVFLFTEGMRCDNLFTYLFCIMVGFVLVVYFGFVDLFLLPFKLLYAVEVKK